MDLAERRSLGRLASPAFAHQIVDVARTVLRPSERDARRRSGDDALCEALKTVHNRLVAHLLERSLAGHHQNLPQGHCERPHVALRRVFTLETIAFLNMFLDFTGRITQYLNDRFPRHPANGQSDKLVVVSIIIKAVDVAVRAEIANLYLQSLPDEAIPAFDETNIENL